MRQQACSRFFFIIWKDAQYTRTQREIRRKRVISFQRADVNSQETGRPLKNDNR